MNKKTGGIVGGIVGLVLVVLTLGWWKRRQRRKAGA
jgi:uncharacterized membrane protein